MLTASGGIFASFIISSVLKIAIVSPFRYVVRLKHEKICATCRSFNTITLGGYYNCSPYPPLLTE
jgi:hypothetical protein